MFSINQNNGKKKKKIKKYKINRYLSRLELNWILKWGESIEFLNTSELRSLMLEDTDENITSSAVFSDIARGCFHVFIRCRQQLDIPDKKATTLQQLTVLLYLMRSTEIELYNNFVSGTVDESNDKEESRKIILQKSVSMKRIFNKATNKSSRSFERRVSLFLQLLCLRDMDDVISMVDTLVLALRAPSHAWELFSSFRTIKTGVVSALSHWSSLSSVREPVVEMVDFISVTSQLLSTSDCHHASRLWKLLSDGQQCDSHYFIKAFDVYDSVMGCWLNSSDKNNNIIKSSSYTHRPEWNFIFKNDVSAFCTAAVISVVVLCSSEVALHEIIKKKKKIKDISCQVLHITNCKNISGMLLRLGSVVLRRVFEKKKPMLGYATISNNIYNDDTNDVKEPPIRGEEVISKIKLYFNVSSASDYFLLKSDSSKGSTNSTIHVPASPTLASSLLQLWFFLENARVAHNIGLQFSSRNGSNIYTNAPMHAIPISQLRECLIKVSELIMHRFGSMLKAREQITSLAVLYSFVTKISKTSQSQLHKLKCLLGDNDDEKNSRITIFFNLIKFLCQPTISKASESKTNDTSEQQTTVDNDDDIGLKIELIKPSVHGYAYACKEDNISMLHGAIADAVDRSMLNNTKFRESRTCKAISVGAVCSTDDPSEGLCKVYSLRGGTATVLFSSVEESYKKGDKKKLIEVATSRLRNQDAFIRLSIVNELGYIVYQRSNLGIQRSNGRIVVGHGGKASPLHFSLTSLQHATTAYLLKEGADPRLQSADGTTPKSLCLFNAKASFRRSKEAAAEAASLKSTLTSLKGKEGIAAKQEFSLQNITEDLQKDVSKSPTNSSLIQKASAAEKEHREKKVEADKLKNEIEQTQKRQDTLLRAVSFGKVAGAKYRKWAEILEPKPKPRPKPSQLVTDSNHPSSSDTKQVEVGEDKKTADVIDEKQQPSPAPSPRSREEQQEKEAYLKQLSIEEEEKEAKEKYLSSQ